MGAYRATPPGGMPVATGGAESLVLAADALQAIQVNVGAAVASSVDIVVSPLDPGGNLYAHATQVAIATQAIAPGEVGTLVRTPDAPGSQFGVTVYNNDVQDHDVDVTVYGKGI